MSGGLGPPAGGAVYRRFHDGTLVAEGTYSVSQVELPATHVIVDVIDITVEGATDRFVDLRVEWVEGAPSLLTMADGLCDYFWTSRGAVVSGQLTWGSMKELYH